MNIEKGPLPKDWQLFPSGTVFVPLRHSHVLQTRSRRDWGYLTLRIGARTDKMRFGDTSWVFDVHCDHICMRNGEIVYVCAAFGYESHEWVVGGDHLISMQLRMDLRLQCVNWAVTWLGALSLRRILGSGDKASPNSTYSVTFAMMQRLIREGVYSQRVCMMSAWQKRQIFAGFPRDLMRWFLQTYIVLDVTACSKGTYPRVCIADATYDI